MTAFHAVVFDVDGTLFDTERVSQQSWVAVSQEMGWPQIGENYLHFVGRNRAGILDEMLALYGPDLPAEELLQRCAQRSRAHGDAHGIPVKPGVREILDHLHQGGIPLALATSTSHGRTMERLALTGLTDCFSVVVTGDMVARSKPEPDIYLRACQALGVDPAAALAVEDSRNGILSAHRAGMQVAMVPDLLPPTPELTPLLWGCFPDLLALRDRLG